jgi:hypothetical protein
VRYHDGSYYVALINNRLNEQIPQSTTTGTTRYTEAGKTQVFVPTANVRLLLPNADVLSNAEELSPSNGGTEIAQTLTALTISGLGVRQSLSIPTLGAAATKVFRFRVVHPNVTPTVLALNQQKEGAITQGSTSDEPNTKRTAQQVSSTTLTAFPNPATESATLHFPTFAEGEAPMLTIADMYGNVIVQRTITAQELVLNTRPFPSGVYVCSVRSRQHTQTTLLHIVK